MKVVVFVKATPSSEAEMMPSEQLLADMGRYNEELVAAGIMKDAAGLKPSSHAVRVRFSGSDRTVINGPFPETKELVAGYWLWEVPSMEAAIEWVKKCPNPMPEDSDIEIRPEYEFGDFDEVMNEDLKNQEETLGAQVSLQKSEVGPYLYFGGRCEEALEFYRKRLMAKVGMVMRFNQSPDPVPAGMLAPGFENKIMHCDFTIGSTKILASDGCSEKDGNFGGFRLMLNAPTEAAAKLAFEALSDGGKVDMPLMATFWSPAYGMVTDRFGVGWMVMVPGPQG